MSKKRSTANAHVRLTPAASAKLKEIKERTGKTATEIINAAIAGAEIVNINEGWEINQKLAYINKEVFDGRRQFAHDVADLKNAVASADEKLSKLLESGTGGPASCPCWRG